MRTIQWPLAMLACFSMVMAPSMRPCFADEPPAAAPVALPGGPSPAAEAKAAAAVDLTFVPASAVGALVLHPQQVLTGENAEMLPVEVITAAGLQYVGFDPVQIQEVVGVVSPPEMPAAGTVAPPNTAAHEPEPGFGAILHFSQAYNRRDVYARLRPLRPTIEETDGKKFALIHAPTPFGIFMPDDKTLVVGTDGLLQQMIAAKNVDSKLTQLVRATDCSGTATVLFSLDAVRPMIDQALAHAPPLPPQFADFLKIPKLVSSGVIKLDFRTPGEFSATLRTADAKSAEELQGLIERGLAMGRQMALQNIAHQPATTDPVQQAMQKYETRMTGRWFDMLKPTRNGSDVKWAIEGASNPAVNIAVIGVLAALLLPAIQAARAAAQRNQTAAKLKQIGYSLLNYESAYRRFPARAVFSKEGKPLLSWRVQILPYLEASACTKNSISMNRGTARTIRRSFPGCLRLWPIRKRPPRPV